MDRRNVPLHELWHGWVRTGIYNFRVGIHTASNRTHPYYTRTLIETPCSFIQVWFTVRDIQLRVKSQPRVEREWCCSHTRQTSTPAAINIVPHEASMAAKDLIVLFDWSCWDRKKKLSVSSFSTIKIKYSSIFFQLIMYSFVRIIKCNTFPPLSAVTVSLYDAVNGIT